MDLRVIPFILTPFVGSIPIRHLIAKNRDWYATLNKASFIPPRWVFGPMWTMLYTIMGVASFLVWRDRSPHQSRLPLVVYGLHLLLNWSWNPVFFGAHKLKTAAAINVATLCSVIVCAILFRPINETASNMMLPYVACMSMASSVNVRTAMLN